ncbi:MAG TPA: hypothetical protein VHO43_10930 [Ignavibacteriales bacterium]|nr:hypothetical protein [Ignavibacteriales bacterium]
METKRKIDFKQARDFGATVNVTFEFIRENFKNLFLSLLLIAGPVAVLLGILNSFNLLHLTGGAMYERAALNYLLMFFLFQMVIGAVYGYINLYLDSDIENITPTDVWEEVKKNFGKSAMTLLLGSIWVLLGTIILILPGVYLMVIFSIIFAVRYRENITFSDAFNRCSDLMKGYWWKTFGLLFVFGLLQVFFSYILQAPMLLLIISRVIGQGQENSFFSTFFLLITTIIGTFSYIFYSMFCIGMSFHYYSLVEKKEAAGLLEKIENMQEQA